jgi:hypothetical protein
MLRVSGNAEDDARSRTTKVSNRSLSKSELNKFFSEKK